MIRVNRCHPWFAELMSSKSPQRPLSFKRMKRLQLQLARRAAQALGFRIVLCTRTPESFKAARAERIKVSGKPSQYDALDVFVREQDLIRRLVGESMLPSLEVDVSNSDVPQACSTIADWLETGGLWAE